MRKTFYQKHKPDFDKINGLFLSNPVLERGLVLSPVIVASYNYKNSMILGIGFILITFFTVLISAFIPKKIPYTVRTILHIIIACIIFIPSAMLIEVIYPDSLFKLGVFFPLLVANSLIVIKSESRFHRHTKGSMIFDLLCHTIGFFIVILFVGVLREFLGSGSFMGEPIDGIPTAQAILLPFSGFIIVGFLAAFLKNIRNRLDNPCSKEQQPTNPQD